MKNIILQVLQLWDPYDLYLFPRDEYSDFVNPIYHVLKTNKSIETHELTDYLYKLIPPIEKSDSIMISKVEYERLSRLLINLIVNQRYKND